MPYSLNGIPSDLLNSQVEGARRLKVEATIVDGEIEQENYIKKEYKYLADGKLDYIIETNLNTNMIIHKTFLWDGDVLQSITPQIQ